MTIEGYVRNGLVARLVTDDELAINLGSEQGVKEGMVFEVLDTRTQNVLDPETQEDLGSIDRVKAKVIVTKVGERLSLASVTPPRRRGPGVTSTAWVMLGRPTDVSPILSGDTWPDGVRRGDPVRLVS